MLAVGPGVCERLGAAGALVRLLAAVKATVLGEVMFVLERALTHVA